MILTFIQILTKSVHKRMRCSDFGIKVNFMTFGVILHFMKNLCLHNVDILESLEKQIAEISLRILNKKVTFCDLQRL